NVGDIVNHLVVDQFGDTLDQPRLVSLVRNFGDDNRLAFLVDVLDAGAGAHHESAAAMLVGLVDTRFAVNDSSSREVRTLHELQNVSKLRAGIVDQRDGGVDNLGQIMWRDVGRHADGDSVRSVHQQVGHAGGQHHRLDCGFVKVGDEVHRVLIDVGGQLFRDA